MVLRTTTIWGIPREPWNRNISMDSTQRTLVRRESVNAYLKALEACYELR